MAAKAASDTCFLAAPFSPGGRKVAFGCLKAGWRERNIYIWSDPQKSIPTAGLAEARKGMNLKLKELTGTIVPQLLKASGGDSASPEERTVSVTDLHGNLSSTLNWTRSFGCPVYVSNRGSRTHALVPLAADKGDEALVKSVEDLVDFIYGRKAEKGMRR